MTLYRMKEWFATKVAQEIRHSLNTDEVFAILKETEKSCVCDACDFAELLKVRLDPKVMPN